MKTRSENQLSLLSMTELPRELYVRQEVMPAQHHFPSHKHDWHQLLYAISGVLVVDLQSEQYFISPNQAIWLPAGCEHSVYSEYGADLKSLYISERYKIIPSDSAAVIHINPLMRELILTASSFPERYPLEGYENEVVQLLLKTLAMLNREEGFIPWPNSDDLKKLCKLLNEQPDNDQSTEELAQMIALSTRTLDRKFRRETGMSLKKWRSQLKLMKAIEQLNTQKNITSIALDLGYSSASPFIYFFREKTGLSPAQYRKKVQSGDLS